MKKYMLLISNIIIVLSIVAGFTLIVYRDTKSYQELAEKQLEDTISLADNDISNHIENSMNKPVMASKTMANDEFLKTWLSDEPGNTGNDEYMGQIFNYLKTYQVKYDYTTVFCVSAQTGNYYYQDGLNKTVSKNDEHDIWYYNFIDSGQEYDLEVDTNEANNNNITVFVNFRVEDDNGNLLGIIGVGLQASFIEETIRSYENDYDLSVYIVNVGGADNSFNSGTDIFVSEDMLPEYTGIKEKIKMSKSQESKIQWFTSDGERKCLITKYDDTLRWYLIYEMETNSISSTFQNRIKSNVFLMVISLASCILVTTIVFRNCNKRIIEIENTDELTGLSNRRLFSLQYLEFIKKNRDMEMTFFMLDIDYFKEINDKYGHMYGNEVLMMVSDKLRNSIKPYGIAARWGGDEFIGVLSLGTCETRKIMNKYMESIKNEEIFGSHKVTVSVGIIEINKEHSLEQVIKKADKAMYNSKQNGRDQITLWETN